MKDKRIVTSNSPVTSVTIDGTPRHYFHSAKLGKCRAILIAENANLTPTPKPYATKPLSKGEQLEALMDCGERLHQRFWSLYPVYCELADDDYLGRDELWTKIERIHKAQRRVTRKITLLLEVGA
jgi:hypothetical protein